MIRAHDHVCHPEIVGFVDPIPVGLCLLQNFVHECYTDVCFYVGLSDVCLDLSDPLLDLRILITHNLELCRPSIFHRLEVRMHLSFVHQAAWVVTLIPQKFAQFILENPYALPY